jgi:hypothetical protein
MKTDAYTKFILTIIAVSLVVIALKDSPSLVSQAQAGENTVPTPVNIVAIRGVPVTDSRLPVRTD